MPTQIDAVARNFRRAEKAKQLYVVYIRHTDEPWHPLVDVHGDAIAFTAMSDARHFAWEQRLLRGRGHVTVKTLRPSLVDEAFRGAIHL